MAKYVYVLRRLERMKAGCKVVGYTHRTWRVVCNSEVKQWSNDLVEVIGKKEIEVVETGQKYTRKELESMKYKELQSIAKEMKLPYNGKKADIIERILAKQ